MICHIVCPSCKHSATVEEGQMGKPHTCGRCNAVFLAGGSNPISTGAEAITVDLPPPLPPIRYSCPRCKKPLEDAAAEAGIKKPCPHCGQRVQVPVPPAAPVGIPVGVPVAPPKQRDPVPQAIPVAEAPTRKQRCLECGRDLGGFARILTCADCGARFCSSQCIRDHRYFAHR